MPPEKKGFWGTIGSFFSGVYNSISNGVSTTATYVKDATVSAYNATTEYIQEKTRNYYWYEKIVNPENRYKQSYWEAAKTNAYNFVVDKGKAVAQDQIDLYMDEKYIKDSWSFVNKDIIFGKRVEKKQNIFSQAKNKVVGSIAGYGTKLAKDYVVNYVNQFGKIYNVSTDVVSNICFENNSFKLSDNLSNDLSVMKSYYGISFTPEKMTKLLGDHAKKLDNTYTDLQWRKLVMPALLRGAYSNVLSDCLEEYFSSSAVPHSEKQSKEEMLYISGIIGEVFGQYSEWLANNTEYLEAPITHMDRTGRSIEKVVPEEFLKNNNLTDEQKFSLSDAVKGTLQDRRDIERIVADKYKDLTKNQTKSYENRFNKNLENLTAEKLNDPKYKDIRQIVLATSRQLLANVENKYSKRGFFNRHIFARSAAKAEEKMISDMKAKMKSLGFTDEEIKADPSVLFVSTHVKGLDNGALFNDTKRREFLAEKIKEIENHVSEITEEKKEEEVPENSEKEEKVEIKEVKTKEVETKESEINSNKEEEDVYEDALEPEEKEKENENSEKIEIIQPVEKQEAENNEPDREQINIFENGSNSKEKLTQPNKNIVLTKAQEKLLQDEKTDNRMPYWNSYWVFYNRSSDQYSFYTELNNSLKNYNEHLVRGEYDNDDMFDYEGGKYKERAKDIETFKNDVKDNIYFIARAYYLSKLNEYSVNDSFPKNFDIKNIDSLTNIIDSEETNKHIKELHSENNLFFRAVMDSFNKSNDIKDLSDFTHVVENVDFNAPSSEDTIKFTDFFKKVDSAFQEKILSVAEASKNKNKDLTI